MVDERLVDDSELGADVDGMIAQLRVLRSKLVTIENDYRGMADHLHKLFHEDDLVPFYARAYRVDDAVVNLIADWRRLRALAGEDK